MKIDGCMLNAYPDSIGQSLQDCVNLLKNPLLKDAIHSFYILPSIFNSDLDRGFSIISYDLNEAFANTDDLASLKEMGIALKLDFVLNHASVLSKQFQDILENGEASKYKDFFVDWNQFWTGYGTMTDKGYIKPDPKYLKGMYIRKPGLPLLMVPMPDGTEKPYWNTFYQETQYPDFDAQDFTYATDIQYTVAERLAGLVNNALNEGKSPEEIDFGSYERHRDECMKVIKSRRRFLGQMDLNVQSPLVWEFYEDTLKKLAQFGAETVRLDAFAYASKEPGARNFLNDSGTWDILEKIRFMADKLNITLLPEIHAEYREKVHERLAEEGYMTYDFFLPGLLIHAIENHTCKYLLHWISDIQSKNLLTVNMLGCHDGIPLLDLRGLLPDEEIEKTIEVIVQRGGYVKDVQGDKKTYYQVNTTYFSALGEQNDKMLLARALQLFMPGKPQIWYLDLFGGKNDHEAIKRAGVGGHKEINRTNLTVPDVESALNEELTAKQLELLRFRNTNPAFGTGAKLSVEGEGHRICLTWENNGYTARLDADFKTYEYNITINE